MHATDKESRKLTCHRRVIRPAGPACALAALLLVSLPAAHAVDSESSPVSADIHSSNLRKVPELTLPGSDSEIVTLTNLRDLGLCLMQIKQQAKNIYLEVTRKVLPASAKPEIEEPKQMSVEGIADSSVYLPSRPEWLVFYVGTLEPIIHLFREDLKNINSGESKLLVPAGTKEHFHQLLTEYETGVTQLNQHLTVIQEDIVKDHNNSPIAREAVLLYQVADNLEAVRKKAFLLIRDAKTDSGLEEVPGPGKTK